MCNVCACGLFPVVYSFIQYLVTYYFEIFWSKADIYIYKYIYIKIHFTTYICGYIYIYVDKYIYIYVDKYIYMYIYGGMTRVIMALQNTVKIL